MNNSVLSELSQHDADIWTPISEIKKNILEAAGRKSGRNSDTEFSGLFAMKASRGFCSTSELSRRKR
uniref:hypothetical protein n=1 Tax=Rhizobium mayense TaxID=1312184 RepID=UPI00398C58B1